MKYCKKEAIKVKKVGEGYLFENCIGVNETSFNIYELCNNNTAEEIFELLKKDYNLSELDLEEIYEDICSCLEQLCEAEVIIKVEE